MRIKLPLSIVLVFCFILIVILSIYEGYEYHVAQSLDIQAQQDIQTGYYLNAYATYSKASSTSVFNRKVALDGESYAKILLHSQQSFIAGVADFKKLDFKDAVISLQTIPQSFVDYQLSQSYILQANTSLASIAASEIHYSNGISDFNAKNWNGAIGELQQVIQLDANYADAQNKIGIAQNMLLPKLIPTPVVLPVLTSTPVVKPVYQYPSIASAVMSSAVSGSGSPLTTGQSFPGNSSNLYAVLLLKNVIPSTSVSYTRYYNGVYIDSAQSHTTSSQNPQYFYFSWNKAGATYPTGVYTLKLYINGFYVTTLLYTIN